MAHNIAKADMAMCLTSIVRVRQIVEARVEKVLQPFGLTFLDFSALSTLHLSATGSRPIGRVAWGLMAHPATITSVIDRLVKAGLVERKSQPTDRRTRLAQITDKGHAVATEATQALVHADWGLTGLSKTDAKTITSLLTSLRRSAGDIPDAP